MEVRHPCHTLIYSLVYFLLICSLVCSLICFLRSCSRSTSLVVPPRVTSPHVVPRMSHADIFSALFPPELFPVFVLIYSLAHFLVHLLVICGSTA